jgi:hypothetical protein
VRGRSEYKTMNEAEEKKVRKEKKKVEKKSGQRVVGRG